MAQTLREKLEEISGVLRKRRGKKRKFLAQSVKKYCLSNSCIKRMHADEASTIVNCLDKALILVGETGGL